MIIFSARALSPEEARMGNVSEMLFDLASIKPIKDFERCQSRRFIPARLRPLRSARRVNVRVAGRPNTIWSDCCLIVQINKRSCTSVLGCKGAPPQSVGGVSCDGLWRKYMNRSEARRACENMLVYVTKRTSVC